jgi:Lrp/AsnC family transcriptional regulator, leucine-responsive regulatory protein
MNRSLYLTRRLDHIDRAIIAALHEDGRKTIKDVAELLDMASPSITARIDKLKDAGAIQGYTAVIDPRAFGLNVAAYVRMYARPGELKRVEDMLDKAPEVVEAYHVTGPDCLVAKVVVRDLEELETVVDRFVPFAATDTAVIQSETVARRLPNL